MKIFMGNNRVTVYMVTEKLIVTDFNNSVVIISAIHIDEAFSIIHLILRQTTLTPVCCITGIYSYAGFVAVSLA